MANAATLRPLHAVRGKKAAIRDSRGRQVILRGMNVSALQDNFLANPTLPGAAPLSDADLARMRNMGVNVIRLAISWSALEPRRGSLDPSYVGRIKATVARASKYGIYTIIDMHNDGWSKYLATPASEQCPNGLVPSLGWDGAPKWATFTNGRTTCISDEGSKRSPAVLWAWINFWHNQDGIRHALVKAWGMLAAKLARLRAIAGYDILNAPDPAGLSPARQIPLMDRFDAATIAAIRKAEKHRHGIRHVVFFEPNITWRQVPPSQGSPRPHFTKDHNIVFAPHLYGGLNHAGRNLPPDRTQAKLKRDAAKIAHRAARYRTTAWVGEWKVGNGAGAIRQLRIQQWLLDRHHWGNAYWQWEISCGNPHQFTSPFDLTPARFTGTLNPVHCPEGTPLPRPTALLQGLTSPAPRAAPGKLRAQTTSSDGALTVSGSQPRCGKKRRHHRRHHRHRRRLKGAACQLLVWSPTQPHPQGRHLRNLKTWRVPGGWLSRARVHGHYRFVSQ
jgi:hypothetical protein